MAAVVRHQGDDVPLLISLTDSNDEAIDIDDLEELYIYVVSQEAGAVLAQFSKDGAGDFTALVKVTATQYRADVVSSLTKTAALGAYNIDVNVVQTDAEYEDSKKNTIGIETVFELYESTSKAVSSG